jgi:hypothetical protein
MVNLCKILVGTPEGNGKPRELNRTVIRIGSTDRWRVFRFSSGEGDLCLLHSVQTISMSHPASSSVGTVASLHWVTWPGPEPNHSHTSSAKVENAWGYTSIPLYASMTLCLIKGQGQLCVVIDLFWNLTILQEADVSTVMRLGVLRWTGHVTGMGKRKFPRESWLQVAVGGRECDGRQGDGLTAGKCTSECDLCILEEACTSIMDWRKCPWRA